MMHRWTAQHYALLHALRAMGVVVVLWCGTPNAFSGPGALSGEGPLLPRLSGPRSTPDLMPTEELAAPEATGDVLSATSTEDGREGAAPEDVQGTLRAFLDEMLKQSALLDRLPTHMALDARRTYLEDRSIRAYREGIIRFPDSPLVPQAHMRIAAIYASRGDRRSALREYDMLLERFPQDAVADDARLGRARLLLDAGDFAAARDEAYLMIDSFPNSPLVVDAYLLAARAHAELGEYEAGETAYGHVVAETTGDDARNTEARQGLAVLEMRRGDAQAAIDGAAKLLEEATTPAVRDEREFSLATMYMDSGDTARGRMMLRRILGGYELNAYRAEAAFLLADSYYAEGQMAQAAKYYSWALSDFASYQERIPALFRAADAFMQLDLFDDALAMVRQVAQAHDPRPTPEQRARAQLLAGEILLFDGQYGPALEELYGALIGQLSESDRQRVLYRIGQCYYSGGHYNEALEAFDTALEQAPRHALAFEAQLAVADCYVKKGWLDDARQHYRAIVEGATADDTPEQAAARSAVVFKLLNTYSDRGLYQDELSTARKLVEAGYTFLDEARLTYRMARAYERLNNAAEAEALYRDVQTRFPATTWARQAEVKLRHMQMLEQIETLSK